MGRKPPSENSKKQISRLFKPPSGVGKAPTKVGSNRSIRRPFKGPVMAKPHEEREISKLLEYAEPSEVRDAALWFAENQCNHVLTLVSTKPDGTKLYACSECPALVSSRG